jgi:hypothetical protein
MTAVGDVLELPVDILRDACQHARRTADHHSKILPAIFAYAEPEIAERISHIKIMAPIKDLAIEPPKWTPNDDELAAIKAELTQAFPSVRNA